MLLFPKCPHEKDFICAEVKWSNVFDLCKITFNKRHLSLTKCGGPVSARIFAKQIINKRDLQWIKFIHNFCKY